MAKHKKRLLEERQKEIEDLVNKANKNMMQFSRSEDGLKEMTKYMAQFHNYSRNNISLISSQYEGALAVAGYNKWKEQGLNVRKGQKGIKIFAPSSYKVYFDEKSKSYIPLKQLTNEQKKEVNKNPELVASRTSFYLTNVFDITQTDAEPEDYPKYYPNKPYHIKHDEDLDIKKFNKYIENILKEKDIALNMNAVVNNAAKGNYMQYIGEEANVKDMINISDRMSIEEKAHILLHEVAHSKLHNQNEVNILEKEKATKEIEAEMSAYVVGTYYGLDLEEISTVYLSSWKNFLSKEEEEELFVIYDNVKKASSEMINNIEKQAYLEKEHEHSLSKEEKEVKTELIKLNSELEL